LRIKDNKLKKKRNRSFGFGLLSLLFGSFIIWAKSMIQADILGAFEQQRDGN